VIVDNFDLIAITILPNETDPDTVINAYTVLAFSISFKRFQSIARRQKKIYYLRSAIKHT
jgi:hypothetical protein